MAVTLDTFSFPAGMRWANRFAQSQIVGTDSVLLTGHTVFETDTRVGGLAITLESYQINGGWSGLFTLDQVEYLQDLHAVEAVRTLTIGTKAFQVRFDRSGTGRGLEIDELIQSNAEQMFSQAIYAVTARFLTTSPIVEAL